MKDCSNCKNHTWDDDWRNHPPECHRCRYTKEQGEEVPSNWKPLPQTNADRIRAMGDEELEKIIAIFTRFDTCINPGRDCEECILLSLCENCLPGHELEWLQQPAEEG